MAPVGRAANAPTNDRDPAHYWRIASEALEAEKTERLRAMTGSDGLRELERLTRGRRNAEAAVAERGSELVNVMALMRAVHERRDGR